MPLQMRGIITYVDRSDIPRLGAQLVVPLLLIKLCLKHGLHVKLESTPAPIVVKEEGPCSDEWLSLDSALWPQMA